MNTFDEILDFLSGIAYYDHNTDTIHNCKKGSFVWWHEKGHQRQWKAGKPQLVEGFANNMILITLMALVFQKFDIAEFFFGMYFLIYAYFEVDAWIYAITKVMVGAGV